MKKLFCTLFAVLLLMLSGCGKQEAVYYQDAVQTETATEPEIAETEPAPEPVNQLVLYESYHYDSTDSYHAWLKFAMLEMTMVYQDQDFEKQSVPFTIDEEGRIHVEIEGCPCVFRKTEEGLVLESGTLEAYSLRGDEPPRSIDHVLANYDEWSIVPGGVYTLDTSAYSYSFPEVLLDVDFLNMVFTLKCYDGSVVNGDMSFVSFDGEIPYLLCTCPQGSMVFWMNPSTLPWEDGIDRLNYYSIQRFSTDGGGSYQPAGQLQFCPQNDFELEAVFVYREDQNVDLTPEPDVLPVDSRKHLAWERFQFSTEVVGETEKEDSSMWITHFPLTGEWEISSVYDFPAMVEGTETEDGSITLKQGGYTWNFHREENALRFDGGSVLKCTGEVRRVEDSEWLREVKTQIPEGAVFHILDRDYIYDGLSVVPGDSLETYQAAIWLDVESKTFEFQPMDGEAQKGSFTVQSGLTLPLAVWNAYRGEGRLEDVNFSLNEHALRLRNPWGIFLVPSGEDSWSTFVPVPSFITPERY